MARRRPVEATPAGEVPPELLDLDHPVWAADATARAWCERHGVSAARVCDGTVSRYARVWVAVGDWLTASGHVNPKYPNFPDHAFARATGLDGVEHAALSGYVGECVRREGDFRET